MTRPARQQQRARRCGKVRSTLLETTRPPLRSGVRLADHTTLQVGGPATVFADYADTAELLALHAEAEARGLPLLPLGQGSNVLVADAGVDALVVRSVDRAMRVEAAGDRVLLTVAGGMPWEALVDHAGANDWHGIETMAGIPGLTGAAPVQNIGAYGQELSDTLVRVAAYDITARRLVHLDREACGFSYRDSRFKRERGRWTIVEVTLALVPGGRPTRIYPDLAAALGDDLSGCPLPEISAAVRHIRARKGMLVDPHDPDARSAGSFFTNPVLPPAAVAAFHARCRQRGIDPAHVPSWPLADGNLKVAAAWLIEHSGLTRGTTHGGAAISSRHTLALTNRDHASAADVAGLARRVQAAVADTFGIDLAPEPVYLGF